MKRHLTLAAAVVAVATSLSAQAVVLDAKFSGTVQSQGGTGYAIGAPISGEFFYDTVTGKFLSFTIGTFAVAPGYASAATISPDQYTALYVAQVSPVPLGNLNSTFTVDLEGLNKWPSFDAVGLLTNATQLPSNLDVSSWFGFYTANADGTNIRQLRSGLGNLSVTAVPEPASAALMVAGCVLMGLHLARRTR